MTLARSLAMPRLEVHRRVGLNATKLTKVHFLLKPETEN
jgi:hypothetical protein